MKKLKTPKTISRRVDVAPEGGHLAKLGFYTKQVQFVVRRWDGKVRQDLLEDYFRGVAMPLVSGGSMFDVTLHFRVVIREHWPLVFELGHAISQVVTDSKNIDKWLLTEPWSVATNGEWDSWDSIAEFIGKRIGHSGSDATRFSNKVKQRAKRLKLLTPPGLAAEFLAVTKQHASS